MKDMKDRSSISELTWSLWRRRAETARTWSRGRRWRGARELGSVGAEEEEEEKGLGDWSEKTFIFIFTPPSHWPLWRHYCPVAGQMLLQTHSEHSLHSPAAVGVSPATDWTVFQPRCRWSRARRQREKKKCQEPERNVDEAINPTVGGLKYWPVCWRPSVFPPPPGWWTSWGPAEKSRPDDALPQDKVHPLGGSNNTRPWPCVSRVSLA